jgi:hypothetical protein
MRDKDFMLFLLITAAGMFISFMAGGAISTKGHQKTAIENNCAQYNSQTGDFEWVVK